MKVILLQNIKGVGQIGDVKAVNDGFGRNFLLPRKMAKPATQATVKEVEALKNKAVIVAQLTVKRAQEIADKLKDVVLEMTEKANEQGTLFAALGPKEIAHKLKESAGVEVDRESVKLDEPIKTAGEHVVTLELAPDITAQIKITVKPER